MNELKQMLRTMGNKPADKPLLSELRNLGIGQSLTCPVSRISYLRAICSNYGLQWGRKFTTTIDRHTGIITATRLK